MNCFVTEGGAAAEPNQHFVHKVDPVHQIFTKICTDMHLEYINKPAKVFFEIFQNWPFQEKSRSKFDQNLSLTLSKRFYSQTATKWPKLSAFTYYIYLFSDVTIVTDVWCTNFVGADTASQAK